MSMQLQTKNKTIIPETIDYKWSEIDLYSSEIFHTHAAFHHKNKFYFFCATKQIKYFNNLTFVYIYDEEDNSWKRIFVNVPNTCSHHIGTIYNNDVYLFGHTTLKFDTETLKFTLINDNNRPIPSQYRCLANVKNQCFIFGGQRSSTFFRGQETLFNHLYSFEFDKEDWNLMKVVDDFAPSERRYASMVSKDENLFMFGGRDHDDRFNDLWMFNTVTNRWKELIPQSTLIPTCRAAHSMIIKENSIYIFGGNSGEGFSSIMSKILIKSQWFLGNELYEYDLLKNEWKLVECSGNIPARYWHVTFLNSERNEMYVHGGWTNDTSTSLNDFHCIKLPPKKTNIQQTVFTKSMIESERFVDVFIQLK